MDTTSRTAAEYLTALESLGFRSAKWDSKGMRQIERVAGTGRPDTSIEIVTCRLVEALTCVLSSSRTSTSTTRASVFAAGSVPRTSIFPILRPTRSTTPVSSLSNTGVRTVAR